jgi:hypothetical protein
MSIKTMKTLSARAAATLGVVSAGVFSPGLSSAAPLGWSTLADREFSREIVDVRYRHGYYGRGYGYPYGAYGYYGGFVAPDGGFAYPYPYRYPFYAYPTNYAYPTPYIGGFAFGRGF